SDDEPTSSSSSQTEAKSETPVNSPGSATKPAGSSKESVRSRQSSADEVDKDEAYRERRRKNNEAAKRSRDARRAKEDDIALRAALLERENLQLKVELAQLKQETSRLRCLLYNS
ncbi:cell death specification 2, partial [Brachionus plicatilis]